MLLFFAVQYHKCKLIWDQIQTLVSRSVFGVRVSITRRGLQGSFCNVFIWCSIKTFFLRSRGGRGGGWGGGGCSFQHVLLESTDALLAELKTKCSLRPSMVTDMFPPGSIWNAHRTTLLLGSIVGPLGGRLQKPATPDAVCDSFSPSELAPMMDGHLSSLYGLTKSYAYHAFITTFLLLCFSPSPICGKKRGEGSMIFH